MSVLSAIGSLASSGAGCKLLIPVCLVVFGIICGALSIVGIIIDRILTYFGL